MIVFPVSFIKAPSSSLFTIATFTDVGTTTWVAPPNVNNIEYLVVGGGGGAGNGYDNAGGGGGGAGMVLTGTLSVTPGQSYNITVGAGGAGGIGDQSTTPPGRTNAAGSAGLNSSFSSNRLISFNFNEGVCNKYLYTFLNLSKKLLNKRLLP